MIPRKMREELGYKVYIMKGLDGPLSIFTEQSYQKLVSENERLPFRSISKKAHGISSFQGTGKDKLPYRKTRDATLVKMMIALGRYSDINEIKKFMMKNCAGEKENENVG